ncbi:dihydrofolate reductase [Spelaeicoccus albus]|uniref:Dihydrofolate reductase n=1 Tax=Spelaeicoccus albus TaxID=1280376 RepID=A0A7Z0IIJ8_9MICO|nr:dihydrofolate reductase [Spelaeicoccus albus]NYI68524.1 dihydrofolate reductase [Spelaeicoccus albus]
MLGLIWAQAADRVIGKDGVMPWYLPEDLAHFKSSTLGNPVVMGRRTWESFPDRFRPLPGRRNIVITRTAAEAVNAAGGEAAGSLDDALRLTGAEDVWVLGGAELFREALPRADRVLVTEIDTSVEGDTFAPVIGAEWTVVRVDPGDGWHASKTGLKYRILDYARA